MTIKYYKKLFPNAKYFIGLDEVGWGSLAGPITVGLAVLPIESDLDVKDSKKYHKEAKREEAFERVIEAASHWKTLCITPAEIETLSAGKALQAAWYTLAAEAIERYPDSVVLVDGKHTIKGLNHPQACIVKGDEYVTAISAASVVAKCTRDRLMTELHKDYPKFKFDKNKGYPTPEHMTELNKSGITPIHRRTIKVVQKAFEERGYCGEY